MKERVWVDLLQVFLPLSFLTFGGGQTIVADIHRYAVPVHGWMTDAQFMELFALSRLSPGPGSVLVTLVGWKAGGWLGALVASASIFIPSSVFIYGLARLWGRYREAAWPRAVETGLAPIAAGMILAACLTVLRAADGGLFAWGIAALSTAALLFTRTSPFVLLFGGALAFLLVFGWTTPLR